MKKQILTALLALCLLAGGLPAAAADGFDQRARGAAEHLYCLGLLDGAGTLADGTPDFNLDGQMTRGEAVTMVVRLTGGREEALSAGYDHPFTDVDGWGDTYVGYAYAHGISNGVGADSFGFRQTITQEEYLTLLLRALGYAWVDWRDPYPAGNAAGLTEGEDYVTGGPFLRGNMALLSDGILDARVEGEEHTLYDALSWAGALTWRELPQPAVLPGPVTHLSNEITVTGGEDLMAQFALQVDARNSTVVIHTPAGEEENYSSLLLSEEGIARFPDVDRLNSSYYPGQGRVEVTVTYRDAARVMAYLEGKSGSLSPEDRALYEKAVQVHDSLTDPSMGAYERVKAFHDYLCQTVTYREYGQACYTAYGALVNGAAVCQGYTQAMDLLCYLSGIDCEHIFGSSRGVYHSWVRVLVDGQWYNVDVTWDDQESYISYDYFLRSDRYMQADHSWNDYPNWPVCPSDYPDL